MQNRKLLLAAFCVAATIAANAQVIHFNAALTPEQEVQDPPVQSDARGRILLRVSPDGDVHYRLMVTRIKDVTGAHLHLAPARQNGGVVVNLLGESPGPGPFQGILADGVITAADLVGPLAGMTMEALLDQIVAGNIYANVHTVAYPAGEIRGQLE